MIRTGSLLLLLLVAACSNDIYSGDNIGQLEQLGLVQEGRYSVISDYYVGGFDFYEGVGLLEIYGEDKNDECVGHRVAGIEVESKKIENTFAVNIFPDYSVHGKGEIGHVLDKKSFRVCTKVVYSEKNGDWLGVVFLNGRFMYFETRHGSYEPSDRFKYIKITE